jgi:alkanesulfonate monooxygenase
MLRFHWSLSSAGDALRGAQSRAAHSGVPDIAAHVEFCRRAADCGIESLLVAFGAHRADPIALVGALSLATERIKFMVACRSGVCAPTYFVQQINTLSVLTGGRVCINIVAGHSPHENLYYGDDLTHDERYARSDEFWSICHGLWGARSGEGVDFSGHYYRVAGARLNTPFLAPDRTAPEIFVGGNSPQAEAMAVRHASCLLCLPDAPERMAPRVAALRARGLEVGLLVSQIARPTRGEALAAAQALLAAAGEGARAVHAEFFRRSDSVAFTTTGLRAAGEESPWLTPTLWTGAVPYLGAPAIALVGSAGEVAEAILDYHRIGVSQFLFMGWPDDQAMTYFSRAILPQVRARENAAGCPAEVAAKEG